MRRFTILSLLLALALMTGVGYAFFRLDGDKDAVVTTQNVLWGDVEAADGVTVTHPLEYDNHLFWEIKASAGTHVTTETDFTFYPQRQPTFFRHTYDSGGLRINADINISSSGHIDLTGEESASWGEYMLKGAADVASRTPNGGSRTEMVDLTDYYDYYELEVDMPREGNDIDLYDSRVRLKINDYFKIPVFENHLQRVKIEKDEQGQVRDVEIESVVPVELPGQIVTADDVYYVTLSSKTDNGQAIDFSHMADGYGIWRIAPAEEMKAGQVRIDEITIDNLYPLDAGRENVIGLSLSSDQKNLLLLTDVGDHYELSYIQTAGMTLIEKHEIPKDPGYRFRELWVEESGVLVRFYDPAKDSDRPFWFFAFEEGRYDLKITSNEFIGDESADLLMESRRWASAGHFAWDGERLAVADPLHYNNYGVFLLTVYDAEGPAYRGYYQNSLTHATTSNGRVLTLAGDLEVGFE